MTSKETEQAWMAIMDEQKQSKLSQVEYCRRKNIKFHQFDYWKRRLIVLEKRKSKKSPETFFSVEVQKPQIESSTCETIELANGIKILIPKSKYNYFLQTLLTA